MSHDAGRDLVFVSYSHANPTWRDRLLVFLKPFIRQGHLQVWADPYIQAGAFWRREIKSALGRACVGVVLLTHDFLASDFVADVELPLLLRAAAAGALTLLVVPIEPHAPGATRFADGDLMNFQWPWSPSKPLAKLSRNGRHLALATVTNAIVLAAGSPPAERSPLSPPERVERAIVARGDGLGVVHGVPPLPPNYLRRPDVQDALTNALLGAEVVGVSSAAAAVGVHGEGGLGKTVMAQGLVWDDRIRRAFSEGIYWLTVGQQPRVEVLQTSLLGWLGDSMPVDDVPAGTRRLRERLRGKACLIVLDDVWQLGHAKAFDVLDGTSRLVVTTRDRSILTALGARDVRLVALSPDLARELLARWSDVTVTQLPREADEIAKKVDYLPLAISLAGAQIRDGGSWEDLLAALREGDLVYLDHPYGSVFKSLQASVSALAPPDAARYVELAVFPEVVEVPVSIVVQLWHATSGEDPRHLRRLLTRLASLNLVQIIQTDATLGPGSPSRDISADTRSAIALHDLQHDFVRLLVEDVATLHARLIDAWDAELPQHEGDTPSADRWTNLPSVPSYRWQFLAHHLRRAGRDGELERLLMSPEWLYARLSRSSVVSLLGDYHEAKTDPGLRSIHNALRLSSHVLGKDATALSGQLLGRLLNEPDARIQALIARVPTALRQRPMLRPLTACLTSPGGALVQTFEGHGWGVTAVTVLPDGQRALSGSEDETLKLWDLPTGTVLRTFEGHRDGVTSVTVLPDGEWALSGSRDRTLKLWDLTTGTVRLTLEGHQGGVYAVAVLPDGRRALTGSGDGALTLWDLATGTVRRTFEAHRGGVYAVAVAADGQRVLSGNADGTLTLWDLATGEVLRTLAAHGSWVSAVAMVPDGQRALSGSADRTLKLWDLTTGTVLETFEGHTGWVKAVTVLPDGQRALSGSADRTLRLWDLTTGTVLETFNGHRGGVGAVTVLPDERHALSGGADGTLKLWDLATGTVLETFEGHRDGVRAVTILPDEQRALSGSNDSTLKLWDLATGTVLETFKGHRGGVAAVAVLPDAKRVLSGSADGTLRLWDLASGLVLETFDWHMRQVLTVTVLPDGQCALTGSTGGRLTLWDLATATVQQTFEGPSGFVRAVTVLPDGQRAFFSSIDGTMMLWDLTTDTVLQTFEGHSDWVNAVTVLPDGQRALSGSADWTMKLWDLTTGTVISTFYDDAPVTCLSGTTRDLRVVSGNSRGTLCILKIDDWADGVS